METKDSDTLLKEAIALLKELEYSQYDSSDTYDDCYSCSICRALCWRKHEDYCRLGAFLKLVGE